MSPCGTPALTWAHVFTLLHARLAAISYSFNTLRQADFAIADFA